MSAREPWHQRLNQALQAKGWTKADLARHSGVSYDNINKYLRGEVDNPRGTILDELAEALDVPVKWLMGFDEPGGAPYFVGEPAVDPGPLDERATMRALRLVLGQFLGDDRLTEVSDARLLSAAHSASDAWRALARQGHSLDVALAPTIASFFARGKAPPRDEIQYAAELAADLYHKLVPLNALKNTG